MSQLNIRMRQIVKWIWIKIFQIAWIISILVTIYLFLKYKHLDIFRDSWFRKFSYFIISLFGLFVNLLFFPIVAYLTGVEKDVYSSEHYESLMQSRGYTTRYSASNQVQQHLTHRNNNNNELMV